MATNLLTGSINWDNYQPVAIPQTPATFNLGSIKDVPTLNTALHAGQINSSQWTQRFKQLQPQGPKIQTGFSAVPSALGQALNKVVFNPVVNVAKALPQSERTVAQVGARLLPGGQNDIAAENQATNSNIQNTQFINNLRNSGKINNQQASKIQGAIQQGNQQNAALIKSTTKSIPTRGQAAAGVLGTAADVLTGGTLPELKGATTAARVANAGGRAVAFGADTGLGTAAAGGNKKQIAENAVLGAVLPLAGEGAVKASKALSNTPLAEKLSNIRGNITAPRSALDKLGPAADEGAGKPLATGETPTSIKSPAETTTPVNAAESPKLTTGQGSGIKSEQTPKMNEAGGVNLGGVQDMIDKHKAVTKATGDISGDYDKTLGRTQVIDNETGNSLKAFPKLSSQDASTLQDFRDAKAAGLKSEPLPEHLQPVNDAIDKLSAAKQSADVEKAELGGHPDLAAKIRAQDPTTYTHRETMGKGGAVENFMTGRTNNVSSLGTLGRKTASENKRNLLNATDEAGNRSTILVDKNKVTKLENGGKTRTKLGNLNLKTNSDRMQTELKPVQSKIDALENEQKILSSTKSRSLAASKRLTNIKSNLQDAYRDHAAISNKYDLNDLENKTFVGKDGKKYTIGQGTQKEITKNAGQKYYTNPLATMHVAYADSQKALQHARFLESTKKVLEDNRLAVKDGTTAPKNFVRSTSPYFQGYKLEPKLAEQLNDIAGRSGEASLGSKALAKTSNVLRQTIVYIPIKHNFNELAGYTIDRGLTGLLNPVADARAIKSLAIAAKSVAKHDKFYNDVLKSGFSLVGSDDSTLAKAVRSQVADTLSSKQKMLDLGKRMGMSPVRAYKAFQHVSVFDIQDILNLARVNERMQGTLFSKGKSLEDAVKDTSKYNFQYKVPSRVAGSRSAAKILKGNTGVTYFGPYTYDKYRVAKNIVKDTANITKPKQAIAAADKLAAATAIAAVVWPHVDKAVQNLTGDKNAHVTAPGVSALPELAQQIIKHQKSLTGAAGSQISVAEPLTIGSQLYNNTDSFTKKPIWDVNDNEQQKAAAIGKWLKTQIAPIQKATSATKNTNASKKGSTIGQKTLAYGLSLAGVSTPKNSPAATKLESLQYDTLPGVQTTAKAQGKARNLSGALNTIHQYDAKVLTAAKADLQAQGKQIPSDEVLIKQLKKSGEYYQPKQSTVQGWAKPKKATVGGFNL